MPKKLFKKSSLSSTLIITPTSDFKSLESYKAIRTNILHLMKSAEKKQLLFTSPYAAAGKTTTCSNLAITFAQLGKKVVIVDADMRRPMIHNAFSLPLAPGLSEFLSGKVEELIINETSYENLYVVSAGSIPGNPSELLHSANFLTLIEKLSEEYDFVFFDAPPVDAVTDAVIISEQVFGTILVVRQNSTEKDALCRTVTSLNNIGANILGYVLNSVDYDKFSYKYGHYYNKYGYAYKKYYKSYGEYK